MTALLLRFWWAPVIALVLTFSAVQTARLKSAQGDLAKAKATITAVSDARAASERARASEATAATNSYDALQSACAAGLSEATKRGRTIERYINAPSNPDGSRGSIDARGLRSIVGQTGSDGSASEVHR